MDAQGIASTMIIIQVGLGQSFEQSMKAMSLSTMSWAPGTRAVVQGQNATAPVMQDTPTGSGPSVNNNSSAKEEYYV